MPETYAYKVRDRGGKMLEGTLEAESTTLVANKLRQMGYVPITIEKTGERRPEDRDQALRAKKPKLKDISVFRRQFATMINSGLSLLRSLYILSEQTENEGLRDVIVEVRTGRREGRLALPGARRSTRRCSTGSTSRWCKSGETGGVLDAVLLRLSDTIEKQVELRGKIKSAMTYPVAVLAPRAADRGGDAAVHRPDVRGPLRRPRRHAAAADAGPARGVGDPDEVPPRRHPDHGRMSCSPSGGGSDTTSGRRAWDTLQAEGAGVRQARPEDGPHPLLARRCPCSCARVCRSSRRSRSRSDTVSNTVMADAVKDVSGRP